MPCSTATSTPFTTRPGTASSAAAGSFPDVDHDRHVPLRGAPAWAVGYAMETAVWHVVLETGDLQVVEVALDGAARTLAYQPGWFAPAQPPLVGVSMIEGAYVVRSDESVSPLSHPVPVNDFEVLYINRAGDLVLAREDGALASLPIGAQPDARLVMNRMGQVALYANASDQRYVHGIMGDAIGSGDLARARGPRRRDTLAGPRRPARRRCLRRHRALLG